MCNELHIKGIIDRKKTIVLFSVTIIYFENINLFSIHDVSVKVVLFIYAIGKKVFERIYY